MALCAGAAAAMLAAALPRRAPSGRRCFAAAPQVKGVVTPRRVVPPGIRAPPYAATGVVPRAQPAPEVHDAAGAARMRAVGRLAADVLEDVGRFVVAGVTTDELDARVHEFTLARGAYPSPLNYAGFPKSVCTSINEVVCHGIPDARAVVRAGDVVKLDVSCFLDGVHGDTCRTWVVGGGTDAADAAAAVRLTDTTRRALNAAIAVCRPGAPFAAIGDVIDDVLAPAGYSSVRAFAGHGIGTVFHTRPLVHHYRDNGATEVMRPGHAFTIEPMVCEGGADVRIWPDGWTVVTADGGRCAQFEHTLLVTADGVDVLTRYPGDGLAA